MSNKKSKVAIVKCKNYQKENVLKAMKQLLCLLDIDSLPAKKVLIKPNLCLQSAPEEALTTHPEVVSCLCKLLFKPDTDIYVGDNPVGTADKSRIEDVWKKAGFSEIFETSEVKNIYLNDNLEKRTQVLLGKSYNMFFSERLTSFDAIVNVAKFKTHSLMTFSGCVKNLYGMLAGDSKKILHGQFSSKEGFANLLLDVFNCFHCSLHVMDAVYGIEGNGPGREGERRHLGLLMASQDAMALDSISAMLMNIDPYDVPTNFWGIKRGMGAGIHDTEVLGEDIESLIIKDYKVPQSDKFNENVTERLFRFSKNYLSIDAEKCISCGLCYNNCPTQAIGVKENGMFINEKECICCMSCREICPEAAIQAVTPSFYRQLKQIKQRGEFK